MTICVSLIITAEDGSAFERALSDAEAIAVLQVLIPAADEPSRRLDPSLKSASWYAARALEAFDGQPVRTDEILRQMVTMGWRSKSQRPRATVAATLRNYKMFKSHGDGLWTIAAVAPEAAPDGEGG